MFSRSSSRRPTVVAHRARATRVAPHCLRPPGRLVARDVPIVVKTRVTNLNEHEIDAIIAMIASRYSNETDQVRT
jgi:hypothetical protein